MKKTILSFVLLLFTLTTIQAQKTMKSRAQTTHATASKGDIPDEVKLNMQARIETGTSVGIIVAYVHAGKTEYYAVGQTALTNGKPIDEQSIFEIGSISKTFTSALLADKVLRGEMNLSDPISKYLPKTVRVPTRNGKQITLQDLATHSSGLPRLPDNMDFKDPLNPYADYTVQQMYDFLSGYTLTRDIGESYEYSNFGMGLLGHILALQSKTTYQALMVDKIADPLKMNNTRVVMTQHMYDHLAKPHSKGIEVGNWDLPALAGAGGIRSSAADMVNYLKANMGLISLPITKAMAMSHELKYTDSTQNANFGLAWFRATDKGKTYIAHGGATGGYRAFIAFLEGSDEGVVVLSNADSNIEDIGRHILDPSQPLIMPKTPISVVMHKEIEEHGVEAAIQLYHQNRESSPETYNFEEGELNALGYQYLNTDQVDIALEIFKLNVANYPEASNPYDSLGEAYLKQGDSALAITNYSKSLELNPANGNAEEVLKNLGVDTSSLLENVRVSPEVLETYVGNYELAPGFVIAVTHEGEKLLAQATGQPQFELFASSKNKFYVKVVEASVTFNADETGKIVSLTLHQNGQNVPGKKIE